MNTCDTISCIKRYLTCSRHVWRRKGDRRRRGERHTLISHGGEWWELTTNNSSCVHLALKQHKKCLPNEKAVKVTIQWRQWKVKLFGTYAVGVASLVHFLGLLLNLFCTVSCTFSSGVVFWKDKRSKHVWYSSKMAFHNLYETLACCILFLRYPSEKRKALINNYEEIV